MSRPTLREALREGPFTLAMSSGFFGFFAHCGVLSVLEDEGLVPSRASGSSAGALVTGAWAAGLDAGTLARTLEGLRREDFWDPAPGFGWLEGGLFRGRLEALLPRRSFAEARVPLTVSAFDVRARATRVLSTGDLAAAVHASCAVPGMFHPVRIDGRWLLDGGVKDRPGLQGVPAGERVLFHHLSSRSPWRSTRAMEVPRRPGLVALVIDDLPRVGPYRLAEGPRALAASRAAARRALDAPVQGGMVRLSA